MRANCREAGRGLRLSLTFVGIDADTDSGGFIFGQVVFVKGQPRLLKRIDKVAYVRFASVYREFEDVDAFRQLIRDI